MSLVALGHILQPPGDPNYPVPVREALDAGRNRLMSELAQHRFNNAAESSLETTAVEQFHRGAKLCESPIEQIMLTALVFMAPKAPDWSMPVLHVVGEDEDFSRSDVVIAPQFVMARYRMDFLVQSKLGGRRRWLNIECDGYDYHMSPEFQQRDAIRDRYMAGLGIRTLRYSGQWIYKNHLRGVADEIEAELREWSKAA